MTPKRNEPLKKAAEPERPIELRIDGGYVVAQHQGRTDIYELVWERRHGDSHQKLMLKLCREIPRQFEREVFGEKNNA